MTRQFTRTRQSWGLFTWNDNGGGQFIRIFDYVTDSKGNTHYEWVANTHWFSYGTGEPEKPATLYRPEFLTIMKNSSSDFRFLEWTPNYDNPDRPFVQTSHRGLHSAAPPLYEVINTPANTSEELCDELAKGIAYAGRPATHILLLFAEDDDILSAAMLDSKMVTVSNGRLTLNSTAPPSVPYTTFERDYVRIIPMRHGKPARYVYEGLEPPISDSRIIIRPLQELAQSYVNWYIRKEQLINSEETMHSAAKILRAAFSKPEDLEDLLGAKPSTQAKRALYTALEATIGRNTADISTVIYDLLKQDDAVMKAFRKQATVAFDHEFAEHRQKLQQRLNDLRAERDRHHEAVEQLENQERALHGELQRIRTQIHDAQTALQEQEAQQNKALQDLEHNVALKLGLKQIAQTAAGSGRGTNASAQLHFAEINQAAHVQSAPDMHSAVAQNLRALGYAFTRHGDAQDERIRNIARQLCRTLHATHVLAADSAHVPTIANALAFALDGRPAQHVGVPVDFSDFSELEAALERCESRVVVLDNVFDAVHEGVLFALNRRAHIKPIVLLPIGSFANLRLVAPEVWQRTLYVPTEGMIGLPTGPEPELYKAQEPLTPKHADSNTVIAQLSALRPVVRITTNTMLMPAEIMALGHGSDHARQWVMPHLCLETYAYQGLEAAIALCQDHSNNAIAHRLTALINRIDHGSPAR